MTHGRSWESPAVRKSTLTERASARCERRQPILEEGLLRNAPGFSQQLYARRGGVERKRRTQSFLRDARPVHAKAGLRMPVFLQWLAFEICGGRSPLEHARSMEGLGSNPAP